MQSLTTDIERMPLRVHDFISELSKTTISLSSQVAGNSSLINKECSGLAYKFDLLKLFVDDRCNSFQPEVASLDKRSCNNYDLLDNKVESYRTFYPISQTFSYSSSFSSRQVFGQAMQEASTLVAIATA